MTQITRGANNQDRKQLIYCGYVLSGVSPDHSQQMHETLRPAGKHHMVFLHLLYKGVLHKIQHY